MTRSGIENPTVPRSRARSQRRPKTSQAPLAPRVSEEPDQLPPESPGWQPKETQALKTGFVAILGQPNVGKSTLFNALVGQKLSIVSPKPQTTRHQLLGVLTGPGYQVAFLDTPGYMEQSWDLLDRRMLARARQALESADLALVMADPEPPGVGEDRLIGLLKRDKKPAMLAINKVDRVKHKATILPIIEAYQRLYPFLEVVPVSALRLDGMDKLRDLIVNLLPEGPPLYGADTLTDRTERFLAAEMVREQLYRVYRQEVPYDATVTIEEFREAQTPGQKDLIRAVIYVNKPSQKGILVGKGGQTLKEVGVVARQEIEAALGRPVYLDLWVKVRPGWRKDAAFLRELGE